MMSMMTGGLPLAAQTEVVAKARRRRFLCPNIPGFRQSRLGRFCFRVPICAAAGAQDQATVSVGAAGIVSIAWRDARNCAPGSARIFAQDVAANGAIFFAPNGEAVDPGCPSSGSQFPQLLSLASGSNFLTWNYRPGDDSDLRSRKRLSGSATPLCTGALWSEPWFHCLPDLKPAVIGDGAGGIIAIFSDNCCPGPFPEPRALFAKRLDPSCTVLWQEQVPFCIGPPGPIIPLRVSVETGLQKRSQVIASDGLGGAIIIWEEGSIGSRIIRAQRLDGSGNRLWGDVGKVVASGPGDLQNPQIVRSTAGRSFILWEAVASPTESDLYAQRIDLLANGVAAAGLYLLRYRYPGGQESRRLIRSP